MKLGKKLAQFALHCGANDLGGTLMEESISTAGASHGESISVEELEWMIYGAGRVPKERTTLYSGVHELTSRNSERITGCGVSE